MAAVEELAARLEVPKDWVYKHADLLGAIRRGGGRKPRIIDFAVDVDQRVAALRFDRLWGRVDKSDPAGCWPWLGKTTNLGYGQMHFRGRTDMAHRVAYTVAVGEIPTGLSLHHTCGRRDCVNPDHLQPVEHGEHCRMHFSKVREPRACEWCVEPFTPKKDSQRFCGMSCRSRWIGAQRYGHCLNVR